MCVFLFSPSLISFWQTSSFLSLASDTVNTQIIGVRKFPAGYLDPFSSSFLSCTATTQQMVVV
jgi:hypothetical protein